MLANLHQYQHEQVEDTNRTSGESQTEDAVDKDSEEYFGANIENFEGDTWETIEHDGEQVQRRSVTIGSVSAVSVPQEPTDEDDPDLPGVTIQVRLAGGDSEFIEQAEIVEVQDEEPQ